MPLRRDDPTHEVFFIFEGIGMTAARSYFGALTRIPLRVFA
jgi:hypothetical protein